MTSFIRFSTLNILHDSFCNKPTKFNPLPAPKVASWDRNGFRLRVYGRRLSFLDVCRGNVRVFGKHGGSKGKRGLIVARFNQGFGFNGGGGGGGGGDDGATARLLGNIALAVGLTYLSVTGQLGWVLDAIVSIWLVAVLVPIVGVAAFIWWAGRDIVQSTCPNCGNEFQIFKSTLNEELQLCPFCSQPFSVVDDKFVRDSVKFSNKTSSTFGQAFGDFTSPQKGKETSGAVVDIEAEVKDVD
ncbi:uncharacterized protein LOC120091477 isoform X2 [Benincasa hispida]|uniref:uncharacterized protein LOC120091477 isoform X2 n=1 Tax=Benincasa hispida TaxID=102211 RepID=UPI0018FF254C|nr:uncharacterized protein LOC120091477 isoform X2 [Benincasa hispida]XP_038905452.1 uncharacterized protein LOC120091477 isoform X2 [Benincasa hispida]